MQLWAMEGDTRVDQATTYALNLYSTVNTGTLDRVAGFCEPVYIYIPNLSIIFHTYAPSTIRTLSALILCQKTPILVPNLPGLRLIVCYLDSFIIFYYSAECALYKEHKIREKTHANIRKYWFC